MNETESKNWEAALNLRCELVVEVPVPRFTVEGLLSLKPQSVLNTHWPQTRDLPLRVNGQIVGWTEFEVIGERLAVRITELA